MPACPVKQHGLVMFIQTSSANLCSDDSRMMDWGTYSYHVINDRLSNYKNVSAQVSLGRRNWADIFCRCIETLFFFQRIDNWEVDLRVWEFVSLLLFCKSACQDFDFVGVCKTILSRIPKKIRNALMTCNKQDTLSVILITWANIP